MVSPATAASAQDYVAAIEEATTPERCVAVARRLSLADGATSAERALGAADEATLRVAQKRFLGERLEKELEEWCHGVVGTPEFDGRKIASQDITEVFRANGSELRCSGLLLTSLPECIEYLDRLTILDIADNQFTALPAFLARLLGRCAIQARNNPLTIAAADAFLDQIAQTCPRGRIWALEFRYTLAIRESDPNFFQHLNEAWDARPNWGLTYEPVGQQFLLCKSPFSREGTIAYAHLKSFMQSRLVQMFEHFDSPDSQQELAALCTLCSRGPTLASFARDAFMNLPIPQPLSLDAWEAMAASGAEVFRTGGTSLRRWHTYVARAVETAGSTWSLPVDSPFQPIRILGPNNRPEVVSLTALKEVFGWDVDPRQGMVTFGEGGVDLTDVSQQLFDAIIVIITGEERAPFPPDLLCELFLTADRWSAPKLLAMVMERCEQLLTEAEAQGPSGRYKLVHAGFGSMLVAQPSIASNVDLSDLQRFYYTFLRLFCTTAQNCLIAIQQVETPVQGLAMAYELSRIDAPTLCKLASLLPQDVAPALSPAITRQQLIASVRYLAEADEVSFATARRQFVEQNLEAELGLWCDEVTGKPEAASRQDASRRIMEAFLTDAKGLNCWDSGLTKLPKAIGYLQKIQWVYVQGNRLAALPDQIGDLKELRDLLASNNKLTALPLTLAHLSRDCEIGIDKNCLTRANIERLKAQIHRVRKNDDTCGPQLYDWS